MNWQILITISIFCYSVAALLQRVILKDKKIDSLSFAIYFPLFTGLIVGLFGFFTNNMVFPDIKPLLLNILLMTVFYGVANIFIYASLKKIEVSRFTIIFSSRALFTIFASSILINEVLTYQQLIGTFFILIGIIIVNTKTKTFGFGKDELFALLGAILFGFAVTNDSILLKSFNIYMYAFINLVFPGIFLYLINMGKNNQLFVFIQKKNIVKMFLLCLLYAISTITFFGAIQASGNSSEVSAIGLVSVITIVLLAIIFLKERQDVGKKIIGAVLSFIGLLLLNL